MDESRTEDRAEPGSTRALVAEAVEALGLEVGLLAEAGSRATGTDVAESDHDLLGFYVEGLDQVYGLERSPVVKCRVVREEPLSQEGLPLGSASRLPSGAYLLMLDSSTKHRPSGPDDVEIVLHPMKGFVKLAAAGNPSIIQQLYVDDPEMVHVHGLAAELLRDRRRILMSKHAVKRHLGYAAAQKEAMLGLRSNRTSRPALVAQHGYDTKYGAHLLRLSIQAFLIAVDGEVAMPLPAYASEAVRAVRGGEVGRDELFVLVDGVVELAEAAMASSRLPDELDYGEVNLLLRQMYHRHIRQRRNALVEKHRKEASDGL